jgi:phytanoyl-CoA hydroxylase
VASDIDELVRTFDRDGFANAGSVIGATELEQLRKDVEPYADGLRRGVDPFGFFPGYAGDIGKVPNQSHFQLTGLWKVSDAFRRLVYSDRILEIGARLARANTLQLWADIVQYKPAGTGAAFHWHQDAPYHRIRLDPPEQVVNAWVALDDVTEENGCMWMAPGSHRWGIHELHLWDYQSHNEPAGFGDIGPPPTGVSKGDWRGAVPCRVRAGEVHFHHALTWHGSAGNRSSTPRRAYTINYLPEGIRVNRSDWRVPLPPGTLMAEAGGEFPILYRASTR